jgi:hypothetical protein
MNDFDDLLNEIHLLKTIAVAIAMVNMTISTGPRAADVGRPVLTVE